MSRVTVVEVTELSYDTGVREKLARLVLLEDGRIEIIELAPGGRATVEHFIVEPGTVAPDGRRLTIADGAEFLEYAFVVARGPLLTASDPFELEREQALAAR